MNIGLYTLEAFTVYFRKIFKESTRHIQIVHLVIHVLKNKYLSLVS